MAIHISDVAIPEKRDTEVRSGLQGKPWLLSCPFLKILGVGQILFGPRTNK